MKHVPRGDSCPVWVGGAGRGVCGGLVGARVWCPGLLWVEHQGTVAGPVLVVPGSEYGLLPSLLWGCGWGKGWVLLVGWVQTRCWVLKDRTPVWVGSFVGSRSGWWSGFSVAGAAGFGHTRSVSHDVHSGVCGGWGVWWLVCLVVAGCWLRTVQWTRASLWLVKFLRAHGGCLGTRNRRRT